MKLSSTVIAIACAVHLAGPVWAHRTAGLLQSSLVEVLPSQVGVEVTLTPGMDIAPKMVALLDTDGDGVFSGIESAVWSEVFMVGQSMKVEGQLIPLQLQSVRTSPLGEMTNGHAEIVVHFTADLDPSTRGARTIVCANRYEPIPCTYQCNGLVPKAPGVHLSSHRRDSDERELTLSAEFSSPGGVENQLTPPLVRVSKLRLASATGWLVGICGIGALAATCLGPWGRNDRPRQNESI
jgi:hypothetical protein